MHYTLCARAPFALCVHTYIYIPASARESACTCRYIRLCVCVWVVYIRVRVCARPGLAMIMASQYAGIIRAPGPLLNETVLLAHVCVCVCVCVCV